MNFPLTPLPERTTKPRKSGLTMVIDKGMSYRQTEELIEVASPWLDMVKLGFGTAHLCPNLKQKIKLLKSAGITPFFGGTAFEAFIARGQYEDFRNTLDEFGLEVVEVSDGSLTIEHENKCRYIKELSKDYTVYSEVGSKSTDVNFPPSRWVSLIGEELKAGAEKVIAEARESGNSGICRNTGEVRSAIVHEIINTLDQKKIIWETPQKPQQVWFIKLLGSNVNLGNIHPEDVIALESLRLGLRADTFSDFLY